ncbi:MAG: AAA family ATPase [Planctomycetaceae bacterium]|jgi:predicted ATP-binding protein involved in virulence|nr:AAA family ATPase [Planctomycetaceae bacterium]
MYIKKVKFTNLKGFETLDFDFTRKNKSYAGWTVFVGGNSSGKSTLLKGIALALMGTEVGRIYIPDLTGWIRAGCLEAESSVTIIREKKDDIQLKNTPPDSVTPNIITASIIWEKEKEGEIPNFRKKKTNYSVEKGLWNPNANGWFCAGYGPMRRLSGSSSESMRFTLDQGIVSRFATLFREDASLSESESWLIRYYAQILEAKGNDKKEAEQFLDNIKRFLNDGLLPLKMKIGKITNTGNKNVFVTSQSGVEIPMRDISDGCRGIFATILDLIHHLCTVYGSKDLFKEDKGQLIINRSGVVLIDEIEAHLHPQWQFEIVDWLKKHFPLIQFLVTTHSSLIAQCADDNGIFVLPLHNEQGRQPRSLTEDESNKIRMGKAGKTLLGSAFGLKATRSSWALAQIQRWKELDSKSRNVKLSSSEKQEHKELENLLKMSFDDDDEVITE